MCLHTSEPGIRHGNEDSCGNEIVENIFSVEKINKHTFLSMKIKMMDLWMQTDGTELIFVMKFRMLHFKFAQILVSTFNISDALIHDCKNKLAFLVYNRSFKVTGNTKFLYLKQCRAWQVWMYVYYGSQICLVFSANSSLLSPHITLYHTPFLFVKI